MNIPLGFDAVAGTLMEEGAKRRLIGAAVVVALLVIFLPMLLEQEETLPPVSEQEMTVPPRPDFDQGYDAAVSESLVEPAGSRFREYEEPLREDASLLRELPPPDFLDVPATTTPELRPEPVPVEDTPPAPAPERTSIPKWKTPPAAKPKPKPTPKQKTPPATEPTSKPARAQPSTPPRTPPSLSSWVIQVASLREHARAYSLVQDLRAKGFPAYLEEVRMKRQLWHRVRIGPELGRKQIESMAASLRRKTGLKGLIQRYP